jgi:hypothetical protein
MKETEIKNFLKNKFKDNQKLFLEVRNKMDELKEDSPEEAQIKYVLSVDYAYLLNKLQEIRDISLRITGDDFEDIIDPKVREYCQSSKTIFYHHNKDGLKTVANDFTVEDLISKVRDKIGASK